VFFGVETGDIADFSKNVDLSSTETGPKSKAPIVPEESSPRNSIVQLGYPLVSSKRKM
jgi:hypothetical protein